MQDTVSNETLIENLQAAIAIERKATAQIISYLEEIDQRRLYSQKGYSSMFAFCTGFLGYSESAAYRRISAARLLRDVPEIKSDLETGTLTLSNVSAVQNFFRSEKRIRQKTYSKQEKEDILNSVAGRSSRDTERILVEKSPDAMKVQEKVQIVPGGGTQITFVAHEGLMAKFTHIRNQWAAKAHRQTRGDYSYAQLFEAMADQVLKKINPVKNPSLLESLPTEKVLPTAERSRYVAAPLRRAVRQRGKDQCEFQDPLTGKICGSSYGLEIDHIIPFALGGKNELSNLRLLCASHNRWAATQIFGKFK